MGGTALLDKSGIESQRLTLDEYNRVTKEVTDILDSLKIKWMDVPYIREKTDFGDIDIIIIDERVPLAKEIGFSGVSKAIHDNLHLFGITDDLYVNNNSCLSILYEKRYQVDFVVADKSFSDYHRNYLSYNDLGNLLGRTVKSLGLTHGHNGLFYDYYNDDRSYRDRILVDLDPDTIFEVLQLDKTVFYSGFDTYKDMFDFVMSSPFFDPSLYKFENLNNRNRVRDKKRSVYNKFLEHIDFNVVPTGVFDRDVRFPWVSNYIKANEKQYMLTNSIRRSVPGKLIMDHTSYGGLKLGYLINKIKSAYGERLIGITDEELLRLTDLQVAAHKHILDNL